MRDRDALAEAGRAQPLSLADARQDRGRVDLEPTGGELRQLLQQARACCRADKDGLIASKSRNSESCILTHDHGRDAAPATDCTENRCCQRAGGSTQPMLPSSRR